jgi:hypothetical protein
MSRQGYWVCQNQECREFDGQIFTSTTELAVCPLCGDSLRLLEEEFDPKEDEARSIIESTDEVLATTYLTTRRNRYAHLKGICVAEIRRRGGIHIDPDQWANEQRRVWDA